MIVVKSNIFISNSHASHFLPTAHSASASRFCYSGGFALNAAAGGATQVVAVDSSQPAIDDAEINAARNNLEGLTEFIKDDALKFMKVCTSPV